MGAPHVFFLPLVLTPNVIVTPTSPNTHIQVSAGSWCWCLFPQVPPHQTSASTSGRANVQTWFSRARGLPRMSVPLAGWAPSQTHILFRTVKATLTSHSWPAHLSATNSRDLGDSIHEGSLQWLRAPIWKWKVMRSFETEGKGNP